MLGCVCLGLFVSRGFADCLQACYVDTLSNMYLPWFAGLVVSAGFCGKLGARAVFFRIVRDRLSR